MRCFVAIEISDEVKDVLVGLQKKLTLKCKKVKDFHITLLFLGDVEDVDAVRDALRSVSFEKFELSLDGVGVFPDFTKPRVAWVGMKHNDALFSLQSAVEDKLKPLGFVNDKEFKGHLTLARFKFVENKKELKDIMQNMKVPDIKFSVDSFKLIKSTLTPEGPVYEVVEEFE